MTSSKVLFLITVFGLVTVGCTSSYSTFPTEFLGEESGVHSVSFISKNEQAIVTEVYSRLIASKSSKSDQVNSSKPTVLDFESPDFYKTTDSKYCKGMICWSTWIQGDQDYDTDLVLNRFNQKFSRAIEIIPSLFEIDNPYNLEIYLVSTNSGFDDAYENNGQELSTFKIAVHYEKQNDDSKRASRQASQVEALSMSSIFHELLHYISIKSKLYDDPAEYRNLAHSETVSRCFEYLGFLNVLDDESGVSLRIPFITYDDFLGSLSIKSPSFDASRAITEMLREKFESIDSKVIISNEALIRASDTEEISMISSVCNALVNDAKVNF